MSKTVLWASLLLSVLTGRMLAGASTPATDCTTTVYSMQAEAMTLFGHPTFRLVFDNDAYGGSLSLDRNAYIDDVAIAAIASATRTRTPVPPTATTAPATTVKAGTTYYVAPDGRDSNPGTLSAPLTSIQAGLNKLYPGDTLEIRGGTYYPSATLKLPRSGTSTAPI